MLTRWDYLQMQQKQAKDRLRELDLQIEKLEQTPFKGSCIRCNEWLETEADFARHFQIPDDRYLGLGWCWGK